MAPEALLPILPEPIASRVNHDLIIAALESHAFPRRMRECRGQRVHVRFSDEFDRDGDVEFPGTEGFIVRGSDKAAVFVDEGDGVNGL